MREPGEPHWYHDDPRRQWRDVDRTSDAVRVSDELHRRRTCVSTMATLLGMPVTYLHGVLTGTCILSRDDRKRLDALTKQPVRK